MLVSQNARFGLKWGCIRTITISSILECEQSGTSLLHRTGRGMQWGGWNRKHYTTVCSDYGLEHDIKFNSAKSNIMIFCCKKFKDIQVPSFEILPRVNQCKYLGHVITDDLKDDNDIARQYKRIYAQGNALMRKFYVFRSCKVYSNLDHSAHHYTHVSYGVIINLNRYENCMLHTITCLDYYAMNRGIAALVICL